MYMKVTTKKRLFIRGSVNEWFPFKPGDRVAITANDDCLILEPNTNGMKLNPAGSDTISVYLSQTIFPYIIKGEEKAPLGTVIAGSSLKLYFPESVERVPPGSLQEKPSKPRGSSQIYKGVNVTPIAIQAEDVALVISYLKVVNKAITQRKLEVYIKENGTIGARAWRELLP